MAEGWLVLIADDYEDLRELVKFWIERAGHRTLLAADGAQAFELACEHRPDIAILDVRMPKMTGHQVTEKIRAHAVLGEMPIVLLTASVRGQDQSRGLDLGANAYVNKPFDPADLLERVEALLNQS